MYDEVCISFSFGIMRIPIDGLLGCISISLCGVSIGAKKTLVEIQVCDIKTVKGLYEGSNSVCLDMYCNIGA